MVKRLNGNLADEVGLEDIIDENQRVGAHLKQNESHDFYVNELDSGRKAANRAARRASITD